MGGLAPRVWLAFGLGFGAARSIAFRGPKSDVACGAKVVCERGGARDLARHVARRRRSLKDWGAGGGGGGLRAHEREPTAATSGDGSECTPSAAKVPQPRLLMAFVQSFPRFPRCRGRGFANPSLPSICVLVNPGPAGVLNRTNCAGNRAEYPPPPDSRIRVFARPPTCTHVARGLVLVFGEGPSKSYIKKT